MNLVIINGSHRKKSESKKISRELKDISSQVGFSSTLILDLHDKLDILWDENFWVSGSEQSERRKGIEPVLKDADAFILVSPEYGGMASPIMKNFLLTCSPAETGHKPAVLVGVSAGQGGTYPISEIRSYGFKNNFLCFLPANIIVRESGGLFKPGGNRREPALEKEERLVNYSEYVLNLLFAYSRALKEVRSSGVINFEDYPYGF